MKSPMQHVVHQLASMSERRSETRLQSLDILRRVRVAELICLLGVSRSTLYDGMDSGRYPRPDGHDGKMPYWNSNTLKAFLNRSTAAEHNPEQIYIEGEA